MSTLVAGYESPDDEATPVYSTDIVERQILGLDFRTGDHGDEDYDEDERFQEQARKDAFGLTSFHVVSHHNGTSKGNRKPAIIAAPDVLKEVS